MFEFRHAAYNLTTGEIINAERANHLKRMVACAEKFNREYYHEPGKWRWCHDFGKKWYSGNYPRQ